MPRDWYLGFDRPGRVAVFRGPLPAGTVTDKDAEVVFRGSDLPDGFGVRLAAADADGDGDDDLLIGAPMDSTAGTRAGAVHLVVDVGL